MATCSHSTVTPVANPCWTETPRAAALLASCAKYPPRGTFHRQRFGFSTEEWFAYDGYRAEALSTIRDDIGTRLLHAYEVEGAAYEPVEIWCRQPDVTAAINAARAASVEV